MMRVMTRQAFPSDIRIVEVEPFFVREVARTPLKFGRVVMNEVIFFRCRVVVENRRGKVAEGWGGIFLADFWAWPSLSIPHEKREEAMVALSLALTKGFADQKKFAHPIDIFLAFETEWPRIAETVREKMGLPEPIPLLATLVCASPIDAAIHDAFGNVNGIDTYFGYSREFMPDLSRYLGNAFQGKYIADYLRPSYAPKVPVFHLVGGADKLTPSEVDERDPQDGLPNCLEDWIERDGVFCFKVKLLGNDLAWDLDRLLSVFRVGKEANRRKGRNRIFLTADTNEMAKSPEYMVELLTKLRERSQEAFDSLLYIEQPTHRDLNLFPFDFRPLAKIKPVFMDESLTGWDMYERGKELGMTGIALKTCKGQSLCLLMVARAVEDGIAYSVQDLTNPSLALLQSVGFAARTFPVLGVEANSRQFFPAASEAERRIHRDIVEVRDGVARTGSLKGPGFGYQVERLKPSWRRDNLSLTPRR